MTRRSEPGLPHKGWILEEVLDAKEDGGRSWENYPDCEFCGQARIRYVHILRHPEFSEMLSVGCDCAEHLTEDYVNPREKERVLRNRSARRSKFPSRKWNTSQQGNLWIDLEGHRIVVVALPSGKFRLCVDGVFGKIEFDSLRDAQLRAFDVVQQKVRRIKPQQRHKIPANWED